MGGPNILAPILSAAFLICAFPPLNWWWMAYIALTPLFWSIYHAPNTPKAIWHGTLFGLYFLWIPWVFNRAHALASGYGATGLLLPLACIAVFWSICRYRALAQTRGWALMCCYPLRGSSANG